MTKRFVLILALLAGLVSGAWAGNMSRMFFDFYNSIELSNHNLVQDYRNNGQTSSSFKHLRNSCGTMAALAVHNYYTYSMYGHIDNFTKSKKMIENAIVDIFNNSYYIRNSKGYIIANSYIGLFQDGNNLKIDLAQNRWGWDIAMIKSSSSGYNYNKLYIDLLKGRPVIVLLKSNSHMNNHRIQHFVVIIYASDYSIMYYDPWDGNIKSASKQQFISSWVYTKYSVLIAPR